MPILEPCEEETDHVNVNDDQLIAYLTFKQKGFRLFRFASAHA